MNHFLLQCPLHLSKRQTLMEKIRRDADISIFDQELSVCLSVCLYVCMHVYMFSNSFF